MPSRMRVRVLAGEVIEGRIHDVLRRHNNFQCICDNFFELWRGGGRGSVGERGWSGG